MGGHLTQQTPRDNQCTPSVLFGHVRVAGCTAFTANTGGVLPFPIANGPEAKSVLHGVRAEHSRVAAVGAGVVPVVVGVVVLL